MNTSKLPLVAMLVVLMGAALFFLTRGGPDEGPIGQLPPAAEKPETPLAPERAVDAAEAVGSRGAAAPRTEIAAADEPEIDPELAGEMAGFVGRVLHHDGEPAAGTRVVLYRLDTAAIMTGVADVMGAEILDPDIDAGEAVTDTGGRFELSGVWPRCVYLLYAGVGTDNPTPVVVDRTPAGREVVDLGDIYLRDGATVAGRVVDEDDRPVAGALVRVVDLPAQIMQMVPLERFHPEGAMIIHEGTTKVVVAMPAWVKRRFDQLPLPAARTGEDGAFEVTGIEPGDQHMVAVTKLGHLPALRQGIALRAGEEQDVGTLRLGLGEEIVGSVIDARGEPVAGAEVLVGQGGAVGEVSFAGPALRTGADGSFTGTGFKSGKVIAAVRRGPGHPWVIGDPQPVSSDLDLVLPAGFELTVRLASAAGRPIEQPDVELLTGEAGDGAVTLKRFGFSSPIGADGKAERLEDGRLRFSGLPAGDYTLLARAAGHALTGERIELQADREITLQLEAEAGLLVRVTERSGQPVRSAMVYFQMREKRRTLDDMPIPCGRTASDGRTAATGVAPGTVRLSALHPRFGWVHAEATVPGPEAHLVFDKPGAIEGVLTEGGRVPTPGKWTIALHRSFQGTRGAMPEVPRFAAPDAEGKFTILGLQPGEYRLEILDSLKKLTTPGSFVQSMMMSAMLYGGQETTYTVVAGQTIHVSLDSQGVPATVEGPSARVSGTVMVDGLPAAGMRITGWGNGRVNAEVDAGGRFDLGQVAAGHLYLQLVDPGSADLFTHGTLWSRSLQIEENRDQSLDISVRTASLSGRVLAPDGSPAPGTRVDVNGAVSQGGGSARFEGLSDEQGRFHFDRILAGRYRAQARHEELGKGSAEIEITAGSHRLDIRMQATVAVSGRMDRSVFASDPEHVWLTMRSENGGDEGWVIVASDGSFEVGGLVPGPYRARVWTSAVNHETREYVHDGLIQVGPAGLQGLVLSMKPVERQQDRD